MKTVYEFAKDHNVTPRAVYKRIKSPSNPEGDIIVQMMGKYVFIDPEVNKDVQFKLARTEKKS